MSYVMLPLPSGDATYTLDLVALGFTRKVACASTPLRRGQNLVTALKTHTRNT